MRATPLYCLLAMTALAGCWGGTIKEFEIHIGWNADGQSQYMTPSSITVNQGDKVRFVVHNDDDPNKDYNGDKPGRDNFHDVALRDYDGDGDGVPEDIEHEAPAGKPPAKTFLDGHDYFVAHQRGTFEIICEVQTTPSHKDLGMRAAFIVK